MSFVLEATPLAPTARLDVRQLEATPARAIAPELRPAFAAQGAAVPQLEALFTADALCVTSGQQPGLLTGPLFTIYKALTAVAIARALSDTLQRPVVPVFWVAGDDHDFGEANHGYLPGEQDVSRFVLREREPGAPLRPLYRELLGPEIAAVLAAVAEQSPETEFRADVLGWLHRHYRPEQDFAASFADALAELLGPAGLVVFRSTHPAAKRVMAPVLLQALRHAGTLDRRLAQRARELHQMGLPAPVTVGDGAALVMLEAGLGRDRLVLADRGFVTRRSGEPWAIEDLEQVAAAEPQCLSANVLLRPVVEAALLPTVAYVAGPGELAYLPQCRPIYDLFQLHPPAAVPRWSGRLIERRVMKVLEKYGITADALGGAPGPLEAVLVRGQMPPDAAEAMAALRTAASREYERLERAATAVDPTLARPVQSARNSMLGGLTDLEKKLLAHLKKQNEVVVQQVTKARQSLFPLGKPQERMFGIVPYLIRYGPALVDAILTATRSAVPHLEMRDREP